MTRATVTEVTAAAKLEEFRKIMRRYVGPSFETISAFGLSTKFVIMGHPRPLFQLFSVSPSNSTILKQINVKNDSSRMRCWDSNSQPIDYQTPPITIRPGLPPIVNKV